MYQLFYQICEMQNWIRSAIKVFVTSNLNDTSSREPDTRQHENFIGEGVEKQRRWSYACSTWEHMANAFCFSQGSPEGGCDQAESQGWIAAKRGKHSKATGSTVQAKNMVR